MVVAHRYKYNPIIKPDETHPWEATATFNGCVIKDGRNFRIFYRAMSYNKIHQKVKMSLSSIGHVVSKDGLNFENRQLFIRPEQEWELFGCEDPRITKLGGKYYIFYTALSHFPPRPEDIKIAVAVTKDFKAIEKHGVTPFNSKAMALFPEKVDGKIAAVLTINTDRPPSKVCVAFFDKEEDIWAKAYWKYWSYFSDGYVIPLSRRDRDQVEVGAPPLRTKDGWLLVYSYIKNYLSPPPTFGIEAVLLDLKDPTKVVGRTKDPLLVPEVEYELHGNVPNVVFPSGAIIQKDKLFIYYGAADTTCCVSMCEAEELLEKMQQSPGELDSKFL